MALVDMKQGDGDHAMPTNPYGYGLRICLSEDQVEALGLQRNPPSAGATVGLRALATVVTVTQDADVDGDSDGIDVTLALQITSLEITPEGGQSSSNSASMLYGD